MSDNHLSQTAPLQRISESRVLGIQIVEKWKNLRYLPTFPGRSAGRPRSFSIRINIGHFLFALSQFRIAHHASIFVPFLLLIRGRHPNPFPAQKKIHQVGTSENHWKSLQPQKSLNNFTTIAGWWLAPYYDQILPGSYPDSLPDSR